MARRQSAPALTPKHFKHFAALTVAGTACLALFANGEGRNELGREVAQTERQAKTAVTNAAREKAKPLMALGNKIHDARTTSVPLSGDDGYDSSYGKPMEGGLAGGGGGGGYTPSARYTGGPPMHRGSQRGDSLQPGDASPVADAVAATGAKPRKKQLPPTDEELDRLEAASEARS